MKVLKRDGRTVPFNKEKIKNAILNAFNDIDKEITLYAKEKAREIANYIESLNRDMSVEDIQDIVEQKLMASNRKDIAKCYIIYRDNRTHAREKSMKIMKEISEKIAASNIQNQNANIDEKSFGGRVGETSDTVLKNYALNYCMSDMAKQNHISNIIYEHDLNSYAVGMHNCLTIPFDDLLAKGFNTRQTDVRPANSINTAFQLLAVIFQLQSLQQFGGVSASHLDWTMIPYVRKSFYKHFCDGMKYIEQVEFNGLERPITQIEITDEFYQEWNKAYKYAMDMTEKECQQAVEGMYHNLNY